MKKCKDSLKYDGKDSPPCRLHKDGQCDICKEKFIEGCPHKLYNLNLIDNQVVCSRCSATLEKSLDFLYKKLFELKETIND